jgi:hypothetical protein
MESHIFVEESHTTADSKQRPVKEYYKGLFDMVMSLYDELAELTDVHLHVLSEKYGVIGGDEKMTDVCANQNSIGSDQMAEQATMKLLDAAAEADVMIVLLSTDVFQQTVDNVWDELITTARSESIWCLGAAQSCLQGLDFEQLESDGCTVLTYQRVGVARLGTETRKELLEAVELKATQ